MPEIHFDEASHVYTVNGERWPSVTQILADEGLIDTRYYTDEARDRGSMVAQAIEFSNDGDLDEGSLDPQLRGYVEAWRKWCRDFRVEIVESEQIVSHPTLRYCGKLDAIVRALTITCNTDILIDVKTGLSEWWHPYQLIAYKRCLAAPTMQRGYVYLREDGTYTCKWYDLTGDRYDWMKFEAFTITWWEKEIHGRHRNSAT